MAQQMVEVIEVELSEKERRAVRAYQEYEGLADFDTALRNMFYDRLAQLEEVKNANDLKHANRVPK
jgi:hypothetical protein